MTPVAAREQGPKAARAGLRGGPGRSRLSQVACGAGDETAAKAEPAPGNLPHDLLLPGQVRSCARAIPQVWETFDCEAPRR